MASELEPLVIAPSASPGTPSQHTNLTKHQGWYVDLGSRGTPKNVPIAQFELSPPVPKMIALHRAAQWYSKGFSEGSDEKSASCMVSLQDAPLLPHREVGTLRPRAIIQRIQTVRLLRITALERPPISTVSLQHRSDEGRLDRGVCAPARSRCGIACPAADFEISPDLRTILRAPLFGSHAAAFA